MTPNPFTEVSPFTRALLLVFQDLADEYEASQRFDNRMAAEEAHDRWKEETANWSEQRWAEYDDAQERMVG